MSGRYASYWNAFLFALSSEALPLYCPQRSYGKVMFSQACVTKSVHRGVYPSMHWDRQPSWSDTSLVRPLPWSETPLADIPLGKHPIPSDRYRPRQTLLPQRPLQRTVRILLECILCYHISLNRMNLDAFGLTIQIREISKRLD